MKKTIFSLLMVLLLSAMVYGQEATSDADGNTVLLPGNNILIRDDFEVNSYPMSWDTKGNDKWKVGLEAEFDCLASTSNTVIGQTIDTGKHFVIQGNDNWDNYIVSARARVLVLAGGPAVAGIMIPFRVQKTDAAIINFSAYALKITVQAKVNVDIVKIENGEITETLPVCKLTTTQLDIKTWHNYAVSVQGLDFTVYIDNDQKGTTVTADAINPFKLGKVGFGTQATTALFDDFLVVSLNGALTTVPAYRAVAFGQYNEVIEGSSMTDWVEADPLLVLGNGLNPTAPNNAVVVYKNGNVKINGNLALTGSITIPGTLNAGTVIANKVEVNILEAVTETADNITTEYLTVNQESHFAGPIVSEGDITAPNITATASLNSKNTLNVDGIANLKNGAIISGTGSHPLDVEGNAIIKGSVEVLGASTLNTTQVTDLTVSGAITTTDLTASGDTTTADLTVNGPTVLNAGGTVNGGDMILTEGDLTIKNGNAVTLDGTTPVSLSYTNTNPTTNTDSLAINGIPVIDKNGNWVGVKLSEPVSIVTSTTINGTTPAAANKLVVTTIRTLGIDPLKLVDVNAFIKDVAGGIIRKIVLPFDSEFGDDMSYKLSLNSIDNGTDYQIMLKSIGENLQGMPFTVTILWEKTIEIPSM